MRKIEEMERRLQEGPTNEDLVKWAYEALEGWRKTEDENITATARLVNGAIQEKNRQLFRENQRLRRALEDSCVGDCPIYADILGANERLQDIVRRIIKSTPHSVCGDAEAWAMAEAIGAPDP